MSGNVNTPLLLRRRLITQGKESVLSKEIKADRQSTAASGNADAERFDNAVRKTCRVSKEELKRREAEWQKTQGKKPAKNL
jgi:hypothetical protein